MLFLCNTYTVWRLNKLNGVYAAVGTDSSNISLILIYVEKLAPILPVS